LNKAFSIVSISKFLFIQLQNRLSPNILFNWVYKMISIQSCFSLNKLICVFHRVWV